MVVLMKPKGRLFLVGLLPIIFLRPMKLYTLSKTEGNGRRAFALKLDMSKACDRVEWGFITSMMRSMGFDEKWVDLIYHCIFLVSYVVTVNRRLSEPFQPEHGLRQGDPLSPYLFLICTEGFSIILKLAKRDGLMQ